MGTTAESPATVTAGVRLSTVTASTVSENRTATLSASRTRTVATAPSTLVGFGAIDAPVMAGGVGAVSRAASSSWHAASNDVARTVAATCPVAILMVATSVGHADRR